MPDAAVAFMLRALPVPEQPDAQTANVRHFVTMMDRLADSERANANELDVLAKDYTQAPLRPRDVLDRVIWFDSVGYRHFRGPQGGWFWLRDHAHEAVVFVPGSAPALAAHRCVELPLEGADDGPDGFSERASSALRNALRAS
jgi:hypothetical protein